MSQTKLPQPNHGFRWTQTPYGDALVCAALEPFAEHFFTTRGWRLGSPSDGRGAGWPDVAASIGVNAHQLVRARQIHGASSVVRRRGAAVPVTADLQDADILMTDDRALALAIQTADCVPLLVADRRTGAVAASHAGWRGLAAGVPQVTVQTLAREFGARADDLVAVVGPSISAARYEVGAEVRERFERARYSSTQIARWFSGGARAEHWQFDGWQAARDQLEAAGLPAVQIHEARLCTASWPESLCSYRRDGTAAGRLAAVIRRRDAR
jgi:polyphenol oxidase